MIAVMIVCLRVKFCFSAGGEEDPSGEGVHGKAGKEAEKTEKDLRHASWGWRKAYQEGWVGGFVRR